MDCSNTRERCCIIDSAGNVIKADMAGAWTCSRSTIYEECAYDKPFVAMFSQIDNERSQNLEQPMEITLSRVTIHNIFDDYSLFALNLKSSKLTIKNSQFIRISSSCGSIIEMRDSSSSEVNINCALASGNCFEMDISDSSFENFQTMKAVPTSFPLARSKIFFGLIMNLHSFQGNIIF